LTYWKQEGTIKLVRQFGWVTHLIEKAVCPFHGEPGSTMFANRKQRDSEMTEKKLKVVTTKLAKQVSGYTLIMYDMQFAANVFGIAAKLEVRSPVQRYESLPSVDMRFRQLLQLDPILRAGDAVAQIDQDNRNENEVVQSALFEAGIVTYGRCFNSGLRTRLSAGIFKGRLASAKKLHDAIIRIRNKHVAHSELKMERSIVGCQLVEDHNYGKRPNLIMTTLRVRRHVPNKERLEELETHCSSIVSEVIQPKLLKTARALREQLLQMPPEQIENFQDFGAELPRIDDLL
jgi:hypothetical protein